MEGKKRKDREGSENQPKVKLMSNSRQFINRWQINCINLKIKHKMLTNRPRTADARSKWAISVHARNFKRAKNKIGLI